MQLGKADTRSALGPNAALWDQAPSSQPLAPARHEQSSSEAALEDTQPWRTASFSQGQRTLTPGAAGQQAPLAELQVAPSLSDTHVGTHHRTLLTDSPAKLEVGGGGSQGESGQKHTQPASLSVTDPLGQHRTGGWHGSGPEILRHEANLSPLGWGGDRTSSRGPPAGKAQ